MVHRGQLRRKHCPPAPFNRADAGPGTSFADFKALIIGIRAVWSVNVIVRHAASFTVATSIT
jgi:hypothetical protein